VADGVEGLKILTGETPPGIALIDAGLPRLNGIEVAVEVKRRRRRGPRLEADALIHQRLPNA
jgi:CheY-like chemotaxis protein